MVRLQILVIAYAVLALACGCSRKIGSIDSPDVHRLFRAGAAPERVSEASSGFFPLVPGNRWDYRYRFELTSGVGAPLVYEAELRDELTCVTNHGGRDYLACRETSSDPQVATLWIQYRQDRDGLYEWDFLGDPGCDAPPPPPMAVSAGVSPSWRAVAARLGVPEGSYAWRAAWERVQARCRAVASLGRGDASAVSPAPGEIQRLAYPLHPGQRWDVRVEDMHFWSWVEGRTVLDTPAGRFACWSIGIANEGMSPGENAVLWFGRDGYLGYRLRFRETVVDDSGKPLGVVEGVQGQTLTGIHLVGQGG